MFKIKKIWLTLGVFIMLIGGFYTYQIPFKSYLAQQKLYELLEEKQNIMKEDIQIEKIIKDYKSARSGYIIYFTVKESSLDYQYDYSFNDKNWMKGHVSEGTLNSAENIIFEENKE